MVKKVLLTQIKHWQSLPLPLYFETVPAPKPAAAQFIHQVAL
jgi:hypothetical protein